VIVQLANTLCTVMTATDKEQRWLHDYLSFPDEKAKFRRSHWGDGKIHLLSEATQTFPAGYLGAVQKASKEADVKVEVLDKRRRPIKFDLTACIDWLRHYQNDAVKVTEAECRGVFHHVTGAGKTEVMVAIAEAYPCTWLILTHRKDLVIQTAARFAKRTGEEVGTILDGKANIKRVTVAMFQSVYAALRSRKKSPVRDLIENVQGVMIDESHVVPAATFYRVAMALKNAYYRYGFSGTPFARGDKKSIFLWGAIGPVIHRISAEQLIGEGVLAKPKITLATVRQTIDVATWAEAYSAGITGSKARNAMVVRMAKTATKPCLLFVKEVQHGKTLETLLRHSGEKVEFVWGKDKTSVRQSAIRRLVHGDIDVLVCSVIFQEGIDIPELQSVVIASAGKSVISVLQDVGRGMRRHNSSGIVTKTQFEVYDINDAGCGCNGRKHRGCKWLAKHTRDRLRAYAVEKYEVVQVTGIL
jgi:superfamily II DNA or RNA helicase